MSLSLTWARIALAIATLWVAFRHFFQGCGSKYKILTNAAGAAFYGLRWLVPGALVPWFFALPYLLLAVLAAVSPFWFIRPYLSP